MKVVNFPAGTVQRLW